VGAVIVPVNKDLSVKKVFASFVLKIFRPSVAMPVTISTKILKIAGNVTMLAENLKNAWQVAVVVQRAHVFAVMPVYSQRKIRKTAENVEMPAHQTKYVFMVGVPSRIVRRTNPNSPNADRPASTHNPTFSTVEPVKNPSEKIKSVARVKLSVLKDSKNVLGNVSTCEPTGKIAVGVEKPVLLEPFVEMAPVEASVPNSHLISVTVDVSTPISAIDTVEPAEIAVQDLSNASMAIASAPKTQRYATESA